MSKKIIIACVIGIVISLLTFFIKKDLSGGDFVNIARGWPLAFFVKQGGGFTGKYEVDIRYFRLIIDIIVWTIVAGFFIFLIDSFKRNKSRGDINRKSHGLREENLPRKTP